MGHGPGAEPALTRARQCALLGVTQLAREVRQTDLGIAKIVLGGFPPDGVEQCGKARAFRGESALQRFRVHIQLCGDHLERGGPGGQQLPRDGANRLGRAGLVCHYQAAEVLDNRLVCQFVVVEWAFQVRSPHGEAGPRLGEVSGAPVVLNVIHCGGERFMGQVHRQRGVLRAQQQT